MSIYVGSLKMAERDLKDRIEAIDIQIQELRNQRYELENELMVSQQEKLKALLGACVKMRAGLICKVIDVPQKEWGHDTHPHFNPYQIPVRVIDADTCEIYEETLFSRSVDFSEPLKHLYDEYPQCDAKEIKVALDKVIKLIKE